MYDYFMMGLVCVIIYMALYALIDRICKCVEHCANARYCAEYLNKSNVDNMVNKANAVREK